MLSEVEEKNGRNWIIILFKNCFISSDLIFFFCKIYRIFDICVKTKQRNACERAQTNDTHCVLRISIIHFCLSHNACHNKYLNVKNNYEK